MSAPPDMLARLADLEIDMDNRARRRDREARKSPFNLPAGRVLDLVSFLSFTCGDALPDDDAGREDFFILARVLRSPKSYLPSPTSVPFGTTRPA